MAARNRGSRRGRAKTQRRSKGHAPAPAPIREEPSEDQLTAFVIMPFAPVSDLVFRSLIEPLGRAAGYRIERADTTLNQRAIMEDVIRGIQGADLVIADLTGRNANVFYELGIAHALGRPTMLIAQSTRDIPFDLAAYRTMIYSVDFTADSTLSSTMVSELPPLLDAARDGAIAFSSPFLDFAGQSPTDAEESPDEGILDRLNRLLEVDTPMATAAMETLGREAERATEEMTQALASVDGDSTLAEKLRAAAELGAIWDRSADRLEPIVDEQLVPSILEMEKGIGAFARAAALGGDAPSDELVAAVMTAADNSDSFADSVQHTAELIRTNSQWASSLAGPGRRLASTYERIGVVLRRVRAAADLLSAAATASAATSLDPEAANDPNSAA